MKTQILGFVMLTTFNGCGVARPQVTATVDVCELYLTAPIEHVQPWISDASKLTAHRSGDGLLVTAAFADNNGITNTLTLNLRPGAETATFNGCTNWTGSVMLTELSSNRYQVMFSGTCGNTPLAGLVGGAD